MVIETKDLWHSAYLITQGACLSDVKVRYRHDGKKEVIFQLDGQDLDVLAKLFQNGVAMCNVTRLKAEVNHLKDVIFGEHAGA